MAWDGDYFGGVGPMYCGPAGRFDRLERHFWLDLLRSPVLDAIEEEGIETRWYGPIQAMVVAGLPETPLLNLMLGADAPGAVSDGHLEAAVEWIESLGVDCRIPIAAGLEEAAAAEDFLNRRGYRRTESLVRFVRDASPPDFAEPPGIEVDEVDEFMEGFSDYLGEGLELDPVGRIFFDCLPERSEWRCYCAIDENELGIGAATMMLHYQVAQLGFAATEESARGKGGHLALLRRRILDAAAAGCRTLFADTEESIGDPDGPSPAARNLIRVGFKQAGVRAVWQSPSQSDVDEDDEDEDEDGYDEDDHNFDLEA